MPTDAAEWTCAKCGYECRFDRAPEWSWSMRSHPRAGVGPETCVGISVAEATQGPAQLRLPMERRP